MDIRDHRISFRLDVLLVWRFLSRRIGGTVPGNNPDNYQCSKCCYLWSFIWEGAQKRFLITLEAQEEMNKEIAKRALVIVAVLVFIALLVAMGVVNHKRLQAAH